jgi:predicted ATP-grasp superfamily ATP-dependent carboligase
VKEDSDLISFVRLRRAGELDFRSWVRSLKGVDEGATFAISDPLPFLTAMLMVVLDTAGGRLWRRR